MSDYIEVTECLELNIPSQTLILVDDYEAAVEYYKRFYSEEVMRKMMRTSGLKFMFTFGVRSTMFYRNDEKGCDVIRCHIDGDYVDDLIKVIVAITSNLEFSNHQKGSMVKTSHMIYLDVPKDRNMLEWRDDTDYGHGEIDAILTFIEDDDGSLWITAKYDGSSLDGEVKCNGLYRNNDVTVVTEVIYDDNRREKTRERIQEKCQLRYDET